MEIIIIILFYLGFGYALYKVAKLKHREPGIWILVGLIFSPIIVLIVLALMPTVKPERRVIKRKKQKKKL